MTCLGVMSRGVHSWGRYQDGSERCVLCYEPKSAPREMQAGDIAETWLWNVNAGPGWPIWRFVRRGGIFADSGMPPGTRHPLPAIPKPYAMTQPRPAFGELESRVAMLEREIRWMRDQILTLRDRQ